MSSEQIQNTSKSERIAKANDGIEFMLKFFEAAGQRLFPRKMTTRATEGKMFTVCSKEDVLDACIEADFQDCRINGYPMMSDDDIDAGLVSPNILFFDLDKGDKTREEIDLLLEGTIDRLRLTFNAQPGNFPVAVLWTGNGYHVYVIMKTKPLMIYKKMAELCIIAKTEISKEFLRFTEKYFTDYKSDINHSITFRSCLLRIPGTLNSKNLEEVKVIREPIGSVGFIMQQNDVLQKEFDYYCINIYRLYVKERKRQRTIDKRMNRNRKSVVSNSKRYLWIEKLLKEQLDDHRYYCVWKILAPYLIRVKGLSYEDAYEKLEEWLNECDKLKPVSNPHTKIKSGLSRAYEFNPISLNTLRRDNIKTKGGYRKILNTVEDYY